MSQHGVPERLSNMSKGFQEEGAGGSTMELLVETLTGTAFEMTVSPSDTIFAIKSKIFRVEGIPISQQHLLHNLVELEDGRSLRSLQIGGGSRLRLVLGMRGGPISTRRLPPPPSLHDLHRDDGEWGGSCKVVLVFRDGDKLNMLHVRDDHRTYSTSLPQLAGGERGARAAVAPPPGFGGGGGGGGAGGGGGGAAAGSARDNAVTMTKMMDLRRRMRPGDAHGEKAEIQKTRSEEILSVSSLLDEPTESYKGRESPLLDALDTDRDLAPLTHELGACGGGESGAGGGWRGGRGRAPLAAAVLSASTSHLDHLTTNRILPVLSRHRNREHLHLSDDRLELPRGDERPERAERTAAGEAGEAGGAGEAGAGEAGAGEAGEAGARRRARLRCALCRRRLSVATVHTCRCGAAYCAPHRYAEVHGCAYDYKAEPRAAVRLQPPKLPKI